MKLLPTDVPGLIEMLDEMYPAYHPEAGDSLAKIQRHAGQRDVVNHLKGMMEDTEREALKQTMKA